MNKNYILAIVLFIGTNIFGQQYNPEFGEEYIQDFLPSIKVTMAEDDYNWMIHPDNIWSSDYQHATAIYEGSDGLNVNYTDLGIRLRGNTSRNKDKKSFKLHFEKYTDDQYFFDLKKVNLKAEINDPSAVREHLTMNLYRENNIPTARVNHIKLYINSNYMGLYSSVEQIDSRFLTSRFNNKNGNLYKCTYGADLNNVEAIYNDDIYELKTNEDENIRTNIESFITFLMTASDIDFENNISSYINIDSYITQLAIEILSGHWDGYSYNKNNFYLYYNTDKNWFEYIPYDTDNTLGIDWIDRDWSTRNIYDWSQHGNTGRPLYTRLIKTEKYKIQFSKTVDKLLKSNFTTAYQMSIANSYKSLISDAIYTDTYYPKDFGYSTQNFEDSYTKNNTVGHAKYGIEPFIARRAEYANNQIDKSHLAIGDLDFVNSFNLYPNPLNGNKILNVEILKNNFATISIINILGEEVFTDELKNKTQLDLSRLSNGIYFVNISSIESSSIITKKLIISNSHMNN